MSEIYYNRLEKVDQTLEELVDLKEKLEAQLLRERFDAIEKANMEYENKMAFLQARFDRSAEKALGRLGKTIPAEVKAARKAK